METQPSKEQHDFNEWMLHPVTKRLLSAVSRQQERLKESWASGAYTDLSQFGTAILNAKAIGKYEAFSWVVELEVQDLFNEES